MHTTLAIATLAASALAMPLAFGQTASGDGQVTKIDVPAARITVKHNGLKALDMPPMVMAFHVAEPRLLEVAAVGDRVRFSAEKRDGSYTLTAISRTP